MPVKDYACPFSLLRTMPVLFRFFRFSFFVSARQRQSCLTLFPLRWYDVEVTVSSTAPKATKMRIEVQREEDQRWLAEVLDLPGVMAYGDTRDQAVVKAEALALRVIADRIDHGESIPELDDLFVVSA